MKCNGFPLVVLGILSAFVYKVLTQDSTTSYEYCPKAVKDQTKLCSLRGQKIYKLYWNHFAGYNCYVYTDTTRLKFKYGIMAGSFLCKEINITNVLPIVNVTQVDSATPVFFDYTDSGSLSYIQKSFRTDVLFDNYLACCREAENCCANLMDENNVKYDAEYCPVVWDAWSCFPRTKVNTIAKLPCSKQAYQSPDQICTLNSEKICYFNKTTQLAEWNQQTNYNACAISPVYRRRYEFQVNFLFVSIALSLPAVAIFLAFEKFRQSTRVILHRNLLIAIVVRSIFTILSKKLVIIDALLTKTVSNHIMEGNSEGCRILAFLESASKNCVYACMLVDGYYLHKVIVRTFAREPQLVYLYIIIAVLTLLPSFAWAAVVGINNRQNCWMVDLNNEQWVTDSFRILILTINTLLLFDIIRVMVSKMKQGSTTRQTKAAFRATLFLIPLFGIHIIVTAKKVVYDDSCTAEDVYDYARYSMEALQGIFVAIFFCYWNTEVHLELQNWYRKLLITINNRFGWDLRTRATARRRTTTATYVQTSDESL